MRRYPGLNVRECDTARAMWETILNVFERHTLLNKLRARREFYTVTMKPGEKVLPYMNRVRQLGATLKSMGEGADAIIGYRARRHSGLVTVSGVGAHKARDYWEPLRAPEGMLILDPGEFYILASKEAVEIPVDQAAEMAPIATEIGEFRAHYAGFFDPGFGVSAMGGTGSRAVLEVRGRDVPFLLRHGQPVAKLVFEPMQETPDVLYGEKGSHYQAQGLRLSKHFK